MSVKAFKWCAQMIRCPLSKRVFTEPVIVHRTTSTDLQVGFTYDKLALEQFLASSGDEGTEFHPNTAMRGIKESFLQIVLLADKAQQTAILKGESGATEAAYAAAIRGALE